MVKAELGFDQSTYTALDTIRLKKEVSNTSQSLHTEIGVLIPNTNDVDPSLKVVVTIRKLTVVKSMPAIVGGSIGGFVFLAIIIVILIKVSTHTHNSSVDILT